MKSTATLCSVVFAVIGAIHEIDSTRARDWMAGALHLTLKYYVEVARVVGNRLDLERSLTTPRAATGAG